jgi:hypothetical protein
MILLSEISPELNKQGQRGNAEQNPAELRWNYLN